MQPARKRFETAGTPAPREVNPSWPDLAVDKPDSSGGFRVAARPTGLSLQEGFA
jgi:hypothetical protein